MKKTPMLVIGAVLIVLGIIALLWKNITYTDRDTVLNIRNVVKVQADTEKQIAIPPILGGISLAAGVALVTLAVRK